MVVPRQTILGVLQHGTHHPAEGILNEKVVSNMIGGHRGDPSPGNNMHQCYRHQQ